MADKKVYAKVQCQTCKRTNYFARKTKKTAERKLEMKKFCLWCRKHTVHKEVKK
ncbi:MAG: 50S ribosomal protein L33 [bacterium]